MHIRFGICQWRRSLAILIENACVERRKRRAGPKCGSDVLQPPGGYLEIFVNSKTALLAFPTTFC